MLVTEARDKILYDAILEQNLIRQYSLLTNFIEIGLKQGPRSVDKYMLWSLNAAAVAGISQFGGRFRTEPIYVGNHIPPHFDDVPDLMDRFISFIHENWDNLSETELAAYGLWRLNWVHPFIEGNGRTARAIAYYLLCVKAGALLPGKKIFPEIIRERRADYVEALRQVDRGWDSGNLELQPLDAYLQEILQEQLQSS